MCKLQGLIFVKKPYFNEPGYEKTQGTLKGEVNDQNKFPMLKIHFATKITDQRQVLMHKIDQNMSKILVKPKTLFLINFDRLI